MFEPEVNNASNLLADYLLSEMRERGEILTSLKLQKMMYYADAWHLALFDREITGECFQAWVHGPVLTSQYARFRDFRWMPITSDIQKPETSQELARHLNDIVDIFGSETAVALERMTHQEAPWLEARGDLPDDEPCDNYISKATTAEYYRDLAQDN